MVRILPRLIISLFQYHNFDEDQSGMKKQLSQLHTLLTAVAPDLASYLDSHDSGSMCFCFRWLLVWFKREFALEDVNVLWEVSTVNCPLMHGCLIVSKKKIIFIRMNG